MSRIFRESSVKPYRKGVLGSLFSFLVFLISYSAGYMFGVFVIFLGLRGELNSIVNGVEEDGEESEMDRMLRKMNEEGPNN
jgi:hypothetical protein